MRSTPVLALLTALVLLAAACQGGTADPDTADGETPAAAAPEPTDDETAAPEGDEAAAERLAGAAEATAAEGSAAFLLRIEADDAAIEDESAGTATEPADEGTEPATEGTEPADDATEDPGATGTGGAQLEGALLTAEGEEDFDAEQRQMTLTSPAGQTEVIVDGTTVYIEMPATEDEQWAQLELDELVGGGIGFGGPAGMPFQTASDNLAVLRSGAAIVSEDGSETIDVVGEQVEATRYTVVIDLDQAAQETDDPDVAEALERTARQSGVDTIEMAVFVDDEDRIVRVASLLDLGEAQREAEEAADADAEADAQGTIRVVMDYHDFGRQVAIEVPADDAVIQLDEDELRGLGQGGGAAGGTDAGEGTDDGGTSDDGEPGTPDTDDTDMGGDGSS